jgi:parallel beta-helix repeat protein
MKKKLMGSIVCVLLFASTVVPISAIAPPKTTFQPLARGNTLYVGGSGPNNYTKIQDAVDNATDGDTVFVFDDSSPYLENIMIEKSISLIGEEKNTTIIDGNRTDDVIHIQADSVTISGFSIINSKNSAGSDAAGIVTNVNHTTITNNIIKNNFFGINSINNPSLGDFDPSENVIRNNLIYSNSWTGIILDRTNNSIIADNIIFNNNFTGITTHEAFNNHILGNTLLNNEYGLYIIESNKNEISENHVTNNSRYGIVMLDAKNNVISQNNFIDNGKSNAIFISLIKHIGRNTWDRNYWDNSKQNIYPILGRIAIMQFLEIGIIPWFQFDWHPAQEPNTIQ